jgi:hypothetical protein
MTTVQTTPAAFPARGKVMAVKDGTVVFAPSGTNYELHLVAPNYDGPIGTLVDGFLRAVARKVWTVPSGGLFVAPIFGPPRTIQGRVRSMDGRSIVLQAGALFVVELPEADTAYDLARGPVAVGALVNVVALPGARFELMKR